MNVAELIRQLQANAEPDDEVTLIVEAACGDDAMAGVFSGKVIGTGTGAENGKCEVYGIA